MVRKEVLSWGSDVDDRTLDDAARAAALPCVPSHVALMPDAHTGFGPPIGAVIPTAGRIIPYAIGVDIGCGMIATETT
jgi:tRNA-splicing ligase RtcB